MNWVIILQQRPGFSVFVLQSVTGRVLGAKFQDISLGAGANETSLEKCRAFLTDVARAILTNGLRAIFPESDLLEMHMEWLIRAISYCFLYQTVIFHLIGR